MAISINNITESFIIPEACTEHFLPLRGDYAKSLRERGVVLGGVSELYDGYDIGRPDYQSHVILFVLNGAARYQTTYKKGKFTPGQVVFFPAGYPCHYWVEDYWEICWFHFHEDDPWGYMTEKQMQIREDIDSSELVQFCRSYYNEYIKADDSSNPAARALADLISIQLDRLLLSDLSSRDRVVRLKLDKIWYKVNSKLAYPWTVKELASEFHVSESHFRRVVLQFEKVTPQKKLITLRVERAKQLLMYQDYNLDEVAEMIGYDSPFSFSRIFKKQTGLSPAFYRKKESG